MTPSIESPSLSADRLHIVQSKRVSEESHRIECFRRRQLSDRRGNRQPEPLRDGVPVNIAYGNSVESVPSQDVVADFAFRRTATPSNTAPIRTFVSERDRGCSANAGIGASDQGFFSVRRGAGPDKQARCGPAKRHEQGQRSGEPPYRKRLPA